MSFRAVNKLLLKKIGKLNSLPLRSDVVLRCHLTFFFMFFLLFLKKEGEKATEIFIRATKCKWTRKRKTAVCWRVFHTSVKHMNTIFCCNLEDFFFLKKSKIESEDKNKMKSLLSSHKKDSPLIKTPSLTLSKHTTHTYNWCERATLKNFSVMTWIRLVNTHRVYDNTFLCLWHSASTLPMH